MPYASDLPAFRPGLDEHPDDRTPRLILADFLDGECDGDPRGAVLRAACAIHEQVGAIALPDRLPAFWAESPGWGAVGRQLEVLAAAPEDTPAFRARYKRLVRGDVPLDPEHLEQTLRLQYDLQARLLASLDLLETGEAGERFITAIDVRRYPLPAFDDVLARVQAPEVQEKVRQGFDTLLLVPFGLPLDRSLDAWRAGLRRNAPALRGVGALNEADPLWVWEGYRAEPLVYEPRAFTARHGGRTKGQLLAEDSRGWDVLLVEGGIPDLPRAGQGQMVGGRPQVECGRTPDAYLRELRARGEVGLTPEAYIVASLDALERQGQVLDVQTYSYLPGAFLPSSRSVPSAYWGPGFGRANLVRGVPGHRFVNNGARVAVRVT